MVSGIPWVWYIRGFVHCRSNINISSSASSISASVKHFDVTETLTVHSSHLHCLKPVPCLCTCMWTCGCTQDEATFLLFFMLFMTSRTLHYPESPLLLPCLFAAFIVDGCPAQAFSFMSLSSFAGCPTNVPACECGGRRAVPVHLSLTALWVRAGPKGCFSELGAGLPSRTMDFGLTSFLYIHITLRLCSQAAGQKLPDTVVEPSIIPVNLMQWHGSLNFKSTA